MALPCNPVLESRSFLCMFRFLAVQFGPVFGLQLHQFTAVVVLYGLDFILQPFNGFLVRGNLTVQILYCKYPLIPTLWMIFEDSTFAFRSGDKHRSRRIYGK